MTRTLDALRDESLAPLWHVVRDRLASRGLDNRGRVRVPPLESTARLYLGALLGRPPTTTVDLAALEQALVARHIGVDLAAALDALGFTVPPRPAELRAARRERALALAAARDAVAVWPEPWAREWCEDVIRAGLLGRTDASSAAAFVGAVRRVIDALAGTDAVARVDLAATELGSAHALDADTALELACARALVRVHGGGVDDVWARAGVQTDSVSGAALTWALPVAPGTALGRLTSAATSLGVPLHVTQFALRRHPVTVPRGTIVLVAENPRVVEAAAASGAEMPVITTNGNPSLAVRLLVDQLLACGAILRYHGDFDTPGLAICERMFRLGLQPWRMSAGDYRRAVADAAAHGVELPQETRPCGPTTWDPALRMAMGELGRIVHEERLLLDLI